jgi:hypothetical protein
MRPAGAQKHFQTPYSPRIHEKNRNLTPNMNVVAASPIAGKAWVSRSINTIRKTVPSDSEAKENAMTKMTKTLTVLATAATLAVAAVAAPQPAEARGGRIAAGIIGGLAAGAIIGGIAANGPYYGPGYYGPAYYGPGPVYYGPHCYWHHQRIWDGYGWRLERVRVCG